MNTLALKTISLFLLITLFHFQIRAGEIINVKGTKALLNIADIPQLAEGDKIYALNSEGKKKALLQIKQVKNQKAVAEVLKGQITTGMSLQSAKPSPLAKSTIASQKKDKANSSIKLKSNAYGVLGGLNSNSMSVKVSSETVKLSGSSFSLKGFYQQRLDSDISVRLGAGYDSLIANGTLASGCKGSTKCKINVSYLGFDALVKYSFLKPGSQNPWETWAGGGLGFLIALPKPSSNVLDESKISTNQNILIGGGADYHLNGNSFIPVEVIYGLFPTNSTTSASQIILKAGYGLSF